MRYKAVPPRIVNVRSDNYSDLIELKNYINELKAETESVISGLIRQVETLKKITKE